MSENNYYPQPAVAAVIFHKEKLLLVKRGQEPAKDMWALPGGKVLPGETMQKALIREIKEETGLQITVGDVVYVFDVIQQNANQDITFHYIIIDFECHYVDGKLKAADDAIDAVWASEKKFRKLNVHERTKTLLRDRYNFY